MFGELVTATFAEVGKETLKEVGKQALKKAAKELATDVVQGVINEVTKDTGIDVNVRKLAKIPSFFKNIADSNETGGSPAKHEVKEEKSKSQLETGKNKDLETVSEHRPKFPDFSKNESFSKNSNDSRTNSEINYAKVEKTHEVGNSRNMDGNSGEKPKFPYFFNETPSVKETSGKTVYKDLDSMKHELNKTYGEIKENKPPHSPNIAKWFQDEGTLRIGENDGKSVWTYIDKIGRSVPYIEGHIVFPPEAKHDVIKDINIGEFTGNREQDKKLYRQELENQYGLKDIPTGYTAHHDFSNGNMQLIKDSWHKEFTHEGGHSIFNNS